jgi:dTDP-4-amino-4,6-dideoxygalactose transaminase
MKVTGGKRDSLKNHLEQVGIPAMIYYPVPLNEQEAYQAIGRVVGNLDVTQELCSSVLSIPMHTELKDEQIKLITDTIIAFFK